MTEDRKEALSWDEQLSIIHEILSTIKIGDKIPCEKLSQIGILYPTSSYVTTPHSEIINALRCRQQDINLMKGMMIILRRLPESAEPPSVYEFLQDPLITGDMR